MGGRRNRRVKAVGAEGRRNRRVRADGAEGSRNRRGRAVGAEGRRNRRVKAVGAGTSRKRRRSGDKVAVRTICLPLAFQCPYRRRASEAQKSPAELLRIL